MQEMVKPLSQAVLRKGEMHDDNGKRCPAWIHQHAQQPPNCRKVIHAQRPKLTDRHRDRALIANRASEQPERPNFNQAAAVRVDRSGYTFLRSEKLRRFSWVEPTADLPRSSVSQTTASTMGEMPKIKTVQNRSPAKKQIVPIKMPRVRTRMLSVECFMA